MGTQFIVIAAPRTGSNHFCQQLRSQPDIWCHGEVFHPQRVWVRTPDQSDPFGERVESDLRTLRSSNREGFLRQIFELSYGRLHVGFKIFPGHGNGEAFRLATEMALMKIVLIRDNFLAVYASRLVAEKTGAYSPASMSDVKRPLVTFTENEFAEGRFKYANYYSRILRTLRDTAQRFHLIAYEEINVPNRLALALRFLDAIPQVVPLPPLPIRGSSDILSRFSNPEVAERYLREHGLMHWAHEHDV
jgi:hypothetical protein